jgi:polysaccharide lyase-like protein
VLPKQVRRPPRPVAGRLLGPFSLFLALSFGVATWAPARADARIVKRLDYESGSLSQWSFIQALPGRISIVTSPRRQGQYAARFVVKPGDRPIGGTGERAELVAKTGERAGVDSWWKWDTYFPRGFNPVKGNWNVLTQWHHTGLSCPPPLRFDVDAYSRRWRMRMVVRGGRLAGNCSATSERVFRIGRVRRGHWYRFQLHVTWSARAHRGFVKVWVNGNVRAKRHLRTLYRGQGVYVKQGLYRAPSHKTSIIYHDGLRRIHR